MGVYNIIKSPIRCPICNNRLRWQSKYLVYNGLVLSNTLTEIERDKTMQGEMYARCEQCETWIEAEIHDGKTQITTTITKK